MSETVETVRVVAADAPGGFKIINKSDQRDTDVVYVEGATNQSDGAQDESARATQKTKTRHK